MPGSGSGVEYFVVPVTVINEGARTGTVLNFDLVVERDGSSKSFPANFIGTSFDENTPQTFAPIAVAGHASATNSIIFTQADSKDGPFFREAVPFQVTLKFVPAVPFSDRPIDHFFANPGPEPHFERVAPVFEGKPASFNACSKAA